MSDYIVFAGVNGAGKSTMYRSYRALDQMKRINSDEIIREFGGNWRNPEDQFEAGRIALIRIDEYLNTKISFNQETTLASANAIRNSMRARELGYYTELNYVGVENPDIAIERIKQRVLNGGHDIPDEVVRKRYSKSINNLSKAIDAFETVFVYDNTNMFKPIAQYYNGNAIKIVDALPNWFKSFLDRH